MSLSAAEQQLTERLTVLEAEIEYLRAGLAAAGATQFIDNHHGDDDFSRPPRYQCSAASAGSDEPASAGPIQLDLLQYLATLALLAYSPPMRISQVFDDWQHCSSLVRRHSLRFFVSAASDSYGFAVKQSSSSSSSSSSSATSTASSKRHEAFLVFRGTRSSKNWSTNLSLTLRPMTAPDGASYPYENDYPLQSLLLHSGFLSAFMELWPAVQRFIQSCSADTDFFVAGHSLGGALASVCYIYLTAFYPRVRVRCVTTFGQPRVGCKRLTAFLESAGHAAFYRIRNQSDGVPLTPPKQLGFYHLFHTYHLTSGGDVFVEKKSSKAVSKKKYAAATSRIKKFVSDHNMDIYYNIINANVQHAAALLGSQLNAFQLNVEVLSIALLPSARKKAKDDRVFLVLKNLEPKRAAVAAAESEDLNTGDQPPTNRRYVVLLPVCYGDCIAVDVRAANSRVLIGRGVLDTSVLSSNLLEGEFKTKQELLIDVLPPASPTAPPPAAASVATSLTATPTPTTPTTTTASDSGADDGVLATVRLSVSTVLFVTNQHRGFFGTPYRDLVAMQFPTAVPQHRGPSVVIMMMLPLVLFPLPSGGFFADAPEAAYRKVRSEVDDFNFRFFVSEYDADTSAIAWRLCYDWLSHLPEPLIADVSPWLIDELAADGQSASRLFRTVLGPLDDDLRFLVASLLRICSTLSINSYFTGVSLKLACLQLMPVLFPAAIVNDDDTSDDDNAKAKAVRKRLRSLLRKLIVASTSRQLLTYSDLLMSHVYTVTSAEYQSLIVSLEHVPATARYPAGLLFVLTANGVLTVFDPSVAESTLSCTVLSNSHLMVYYQLHYQAATNRLFLVSRTTVHYCSLADVDKPDFLQSFRSAFAPLPQQPPARATCMTSQGDVLVVGTYCGAVYLLDPARLTFSELAVTPGQTFVTCVHSLGDRIVVGDITDSVYVYSQRQDHAELACEQWLRDGLCSSGELVELTRNSVGHGVSGSFSFMELPRQAATQAPLLFSHRIGSSKLLPANNSRSSSSSSSSSSSTTHFAAVATESSALGSLLAQSHHPSSEHAEDYLEKSRGVTSICSVNDEVWVCASGRLMRFDKNCACTAVSTDCRVISVRQVSPTRVILVGEQAAVYDVEGEYFCKPFSTGASIRHVVSVPSVTPNEVGATEKHYMTSKYLLMEVYVMPFHRSSQQPALQPAPAPEPAPPVKKKSFFSKFI